MTPSPTIRAFFALVAVTVPLALAGCGGSSFSAGSGEPDGSTLDGGPDGDIIVGTGHDASSPGLDAAHEHDAHEDARPAEGGPAGDSGEADSAMMREAGGDGSTGCPSGYLDCMGTCTQEGLTNCGTCGHDCANLPHVSGTVTCGTGGVCTFTNADCAPGWAHCTGGPDNGCETSTAASPNCGGCGVTCAGGNPVCNGTSCVSGCSGSTPTYCTNTSTCVNTTDDPQNCSACEHVCPAGPANSTTSCASSACGWGCNSGYSGCPAGSPTSCQNLSTDTNNCGTCAHVCPGPVAGMGTTTCSGGACGVTCTGVTPNECGSGSSISCVNESTDVNNCGTCTHVCPSGPSNSTPDCSGGSCGWTCNTNYEQCGSSCLLAVPDASAGVFVAQGGALTGCGTESTPCGTIQAALAVVAGSGGAKTLIYIAQSMMPYVGSFSQPTNLVVTYQGGWVYSSGSQWTRACALDPTQVVLEGNSGFTLELQSGTATLDTLSLQTIAASSNMLTGVSVTGAGTVLNLTNVAIDVAAGTNGTTPGAGSPGAAPLAAGSCGAAGTGAAGAPGAGAVNGTYGNGGLSLATGTAGTVGQQGTNGAAGTGFTCKTGYPCTWIPAQGCVQSSTTAETSCGTNGVGGCGSGASGGGSPGTSGGSSVGIFSWGATVNMTAVTITTGNGGTGGNGGSSGSVVPGSSGTSGAPGSTSVPNACSTYLSQSSCGSDIARGAAGSAGGMGGTGGLGGQGGGGAGGDSFCYVYDSTSIVNAAGLTSCTAGQGGQAGSGGSPAAAAGRTGTSHETP